MHLLIREKLRPFSHLPGTLLLLPGTSHRLEIYPALLKIDETEIPIGIQGPVDHFTVINDLDAQEVRVFGFARTGYFSYRIKGKELIFCKGVPTTFGPHILRPKEALPLPLSSPSPRSPRLLERLSFGNHKSQEWEKIRKRRDPKEIFPLWFALGQMLPSPDGEDVEEDLLTLFDSAFEGILVPTLEKRTLLGFTTPIKGGLSLLSRGSQKIRSLFFQRRANSLSFLPALPSILPCGRFIHIHEEGIGEIAFAWSKGKLRQVILTLPTAQTLELHAPPFTSCRVRQSRQSCGNQSPLTLTLPAGTYLLDRFEK